MTKYILTAPVSFPSAKLLRDKIAELINQKIVVTSKEETVPNKGDILFSYGKPSHYSRLNSADFMNLASNKKSFSSLAVRNGFISPVFNKTQPSMNDYPVMVRTTLTGHGGKGIHICHNPKMFNDIWNDSYYWTKFTATDFEIRAHVFDGEILRIFKKVKIVAEEEEDDYPVRNLDGGYHFSLQDKNKYPKVSQLVTRLHPLLSGAVFYGLDLGYVPTEKEYMIFEANTACGLNEETSNLYARKIVQKLNLQ